MPQLVRFMMRHAAIGFAIAIAFVTVLMVSDFNGVGTLILGSDMWYVALFMLTFFTGLTCASVQMGLAIFALGEDDETPGTGERVWARAVSAVRAWLAPPPQRAPAMVKPSRRAHR
ncbi:MAG: hypothetical protein HQL36_03835 [Alphaproteobacteria bacterium]|nr:hypothetical protein [Alphaproteobacteria bacterium]